MRSWVTRKKNLLLLFCGLAVLTVLGIGGASLLRSKADETPSLKEIIAGNPILREDMYQGKDTPELPGTNGEVYLFLDGSVQYCVDDTGFIVRYDQLSEEIKEASRKVSPSAQNGERAARNACELFDAVYFRQEEEWGNEKKTVCQPVPEIGYLVTINLLDGHKEETGDMASIVCGGDGTVLNAMFLKAVWHDDRPEISREEAEARAWEVFYEEFPKENYLGKFNQDTFLDARIGKTERRNWRGNLFWEIQIPARFRSDMLPSGEETITYTIRINVWTGECDSYTHTK